MLDTGFNGDLMIGRRDAEQLGVALRDAHLDVELAGGVVQSVTAGWLSVDWLGKPTRTDVLVAPDENRDQRTRHDEPIALLGTRMLSPHLLLIDFAKRTVELERTE